MTLDQADPVQVRTEPGKDARGIFSRLISSTPDHLNVAFVHQKDPKRSIWVQSHDDGRIHLEQVLPGKVTVKSYFDADTPTLAENIWTRPWPTGPKWCSQPPPS